MCQDMVVKRLAPGASLPGFNSRLLHLLAVQKNYLISLYLHFPILNVMMLKVIDLRLSNTPV